MFKQLHINITLADALILMPKYQKMLKALLSNKEKLKELANTPLNENCSVVILKKLPKKLGDPGKFLISCGFSELKCKAIADLGASINFMPLSVWKKLGLPKLISTRIALKLANRAICTQAGFARDVFVLVGKFTFPADFVIVDYESDPRVPLILGRPFLRTTPKWQLEVKNDIFDLEGGNVLPEKLLDLDSTKDLHPPLHVNPLSGSTTYSSSPNQLLEELADELALITFPSKYDDDLYLADLHNNFVDSMPEMFTDEHALDYSSPLIFDKYDDDFLEVESDTENDINSNLKDSIDQSNLANPANNFVNYMPEMFTDEHVLDYSSPPIFYEYDDDFLEVESDTENVYDDPFDSEGEKIKESKLLINELDLPCDFLPPFEYDSFIS
nr:reverse transcriptase domain-containing protein [Tanacetum cinerariifolium]